VAEIIPIEPRTDNAV